MNHKEEVLFLLRGDFYEKEIYDLKPSVMETDYICEEYIISGEETIEPAGVCLFGNNIVVCDKQKHCLFVLDIEGNFIKKIGSLGNGQGKFTKPTGITTYNDELYVLDAGNNRVQILDKDFAYVREEALEPLVHEPAGYNYCDIEVDGNGAIYVSTDSVGQYDAYISVIKNDTTKKLDMPILGFMGECDGTIYAVETLELYTDGNNEGAANGRNSIYKIENDKFTEIAELPNKLAPTDLCLKDDEFYTVSSLWGAVISIPVDGSERKTLVDLNEPGFAMYIEYIPENDSFFVCDSQNNLMYRIHK